jgi:tRNA threonylcarbamoyladenosine biosynthesis protein TsaE
VRVEVPTAEAMQALGRQLAGVLAAGDLLIASGDLGAGKTTLTQGIGAGLDVTGAIISPTFVLARIHPARDSGPALVHVDAYRLGSFAEVEDLDLEVSLADSVTLVEWGTGLAEGLADDRLEIDIRRSIDPDDDTRWVFLTPIGPGWQARRQQLEGMQ